MISILLLFLFGTAITSVSDFNSETVYDVDVDIKHENNDEIDLDTKISKRMFVFSFDPEQGKEPSLEFDFVNNCSTVFGDDQVNGNNVYGVCICPWMIRLGCGCVFDDDVELE